MRHELLQSTVNIKPHDNAEKMAVWTAEMVDGEMETVILDAETWYQAVVEKQAEYTVEIALKLVCRTGNWGPWTDEEKFGGSRASALNS